MRLSFRKVRIYCLLGNLTVIGVVFWMIGKVLQGTILVLAQEFFMVLKETRNCCAIYNKS